MQRRALLAALMSVAPWCVVFMLVSPLPVHAYVDPGNGLFLLQAAGSIIVGVAFMARSKIRGLIARVGRVFGRGEKGSSEPDSPGDDP